MQALLPPRRGRWREQPLWAKVTVAVLVLGSGLITAWNIGDSGYSTFYSTATRSMTLSWRAFGFGTFDPRGRLASGQLTREWPVAIGHSSRN